MKKFFSVNSGKKGIFVAKNLIIFAVLIAVCGLSVWSWMTWGQRTDADGLNVKSTADGVQVSWDGENFYDNLTARDKSDVVAEKTGLAKDLRNADGTPFNLDLISGNGLEFFEPNINRRTGLTLLNPDSSWQGVKVDDSNSKGRYIDLELYFRSDSARDVYLAGDSSVSPKSPDGAGNYSDYGTFSKDYISAASRVAFLNEKKDQCSFVWAPNANIQLVENESGYQKVTNLIEEGISTVRYFEINNNDTCALVNPENSVALSRLVNFKKNVYFIDEDKMFVTPLSITNNEFFTVTKAGDKHEATYKFKNASNNQFLTVTSGALSFTETGSEFTLKYVDGLDCPVLATGGYCLAFNNGVVKAVAESSLNIKEAITVYTGSAYELLTNSSFYETCQYYDYDLKEVVEHNSSSTPKLFTTPTTASATDRVGNAKIVTLTKENEDDHYFTAHIVIRIWVEGTDREAKTPLADGVFNVSLHFTSI